MPYIGRPLQAGVRRRYIYAATAGQTSFSGNDSSGISLAYDDSLFLDVYQNGVLLKPVTDYASTTGTSVVLTTGASTDDVLEMLVFDTFGVADTVSAKDGGSFAGAVSMASTLTVDADGATVATFDRATNDGAILDLQKDGTTVGSLGVGNGSSYAYIGTGDTGLMFNSASDFIQPWNPSTNGSKDNALNLGNAGNRFKDIYLSGNIYLGGTGSANALDDYEEGTFSPTFQQGMSVSSYSAQNGRYTKVGNLVTAQIDLDINSGSANSSQVFIGGLPFTSFDGAPYGGGFISYNGGWHNALVSFLVIANATYLALYAQADGGVIAGNALSDFDATIRITAIYIAA
tara:strand:- start:467 stop:1501 length:1035 start_codon:yes stop_codon:yes gene_type:complete